MGSVATTSARSSALRWAIGISRGYHFFNAAPYIMTLLIMIASVSPKRSLKGAPGELSITK